MSKNTAKIKLIQTRLSMGISQEEMADLIGMSQSNYSRRENGHKKISETEWIKIAKELKVEKDVIYEADEESIGINMQQFSIPNFIMEHIEYLKKENKSLKEKLKEIKSKNSNS